jgi:hypothetical protein
MYFQRPFSALRSGCGEGPFDFGQGFYAALVAREGAISRKLLTNASISG